MNADSSPTSGAGNPRINPAVPYILYGAFVFSCFIYGGLIASGLLREAVGPVALELPVPLFVIFGFLSLAHIPLALVMGRSIALNALTDPIELFRGIIRKLVLQCAFFEAIAIYGLVGYILGMDAIASLFFVGFGLACLVGLMPALQAEMERLKRLIRESPASSTQRS